MSEVKWIKVSTNMFETNRKIKQIEKMPEGDTILVIWLKLMLLAGNINDGGQIYLTPEIPYTDDMLADELRRPLNTVKMALQIFERFGMIEIVDNILCLSSWEKYQSTERLAEIREYNRLAKQKSRAKQKALVAPHDDVNDNVNDMSMTCQRGHDTEEEKEEDKEKEIHSFTHSCGGAVGMDVENSVENARKLLGGTLGGGVVMLSDEQMEILLEKLSIDEFNHYVGIIRDCEFQGKHFKKKTHYQAILDMAEKDRRR